MMGLSLDPWSLFLGVLFGCIGFAAWQYGRRTQQARHMVLGLALMGFGFLVEDPLTNGLIGAVLTSFLFWPR
ncbi:MAG: hypothetical protein Q8P41_03165 [Pseudomonadota bacterium]|nr:hypothetical protein [Pseudomonadota bacterium]